MKKLSIAVVLGFTLLSIACKQPATANQNTSAEVLTFVADSFKLASKAYFTAEGDTTQATVSMQTLVAKGGVAGVATAINDTLSSFFNTTMQMSETVTKFPTAREAAADFIKEFENFKKEEPTSFQSWDTEITAQAPFVNSKVAVICINTQGYTGGAHGYMVENCLNFDATTGRLLSLSDILQDSTGFKKVAEILFRAEYAKDEKGNPISKLTDVGFFEDGFVLPDNYMVTATGIRLVWGQYEIAPYAMGTQQIDVPYEKTRGLLRNELIGIESK